jgi:hypothetical protein
MIKATIRYDRNWEEWVVSLRIDGKRQPEAKWYFCGDREDATDTAVQMVKWERMNQMRQVMGATK